MSMRIAVGAVYQTVTRCFSIVSVPAIAREAGVHHHLRHAERPRADDAVARAGHPPRVGRAPVDVVVLEIQHDLGRQVLGEDAAVDVHRAFRLPGGAAGVVKHARRLGVRLEHRERLEPVRHHRERHFSLAERPAVLLVVNHDHGLQRRNPLADTADLSEVLALRDDGDRRAVLHPRVQRILAERREERLDHGAELEDAHEADVELGHALQEQAHAIEIPDAEAAQVRRPTVREPLEVAIGELSQVAVVILVDERELVAPARLHVTVDAELGDVDRRALGVAEFPLRDVPGDLLPQLLVVDRARLRGIHECLREARRNDGARCARRTSGTGGAV